TGKSFEGAQDCFLQHVLCVCVVARQPARQIVRGIQMRHDCQFKTRACVLCLQTFFSLRRERARLNIRLNASQFYSRREINAACGNICMSEMVWTNVRHCKTGQRRSSGDMSAASSAINLKARTRIMELKRLWHWLLNPPTDAPAATILLRLMAGGVFLWEGILKFVYPNQGIGRFTKLGLPAPQAMANFVGV